MYHLFTAHPSYGLHFVMQRPSPLSARNERGNQCPSPNICESNSHLHIFLQYLNIFTSYNSRTFCLFQKQPFTSRLRQQLVLSCDCFRHHVSSSDDRRVLLWASKYHRPDSATLAHVKQCISLCKWLP